MITVLSFAREKGLDAASLRKRLRKHGVPMAKAIDPASRQTVLVLDHAAELMARRLYPSTLVAQTPEAA